MKGKKSAKLLKRWHALVMPGNLVALQTNWNYARFARRAGREIRKGNRKLLLLSKVGPIGERIYIPLIGLVAGYFGFVWPLLVFALLYPFISLADPWVWRRAYGRMAEGLGYQVSFLVNFDLLYWFALGWLIGWAIP